MENPTASLVWIKNKVIKDKFYVVAEEEIECWTHEKTEEDHRKPSWWGNGQKLLSEWDYEENEEEDEEVGCKFCEDADEMYNTVCYIPYDNGHATDIPVNFCPNCGRKLTY